MRHHRYPEEAKMDAMFRTSKSTFDIGSRHHIERCVKLIELMQRVCGKLEDIGSQHKDDEEYGKLFRNLGDIGYYCRHTIIYREDAVDAARDILGK